MGYGVRVAHQTLTLAVPVRIRISLFQKIFKKQKRPMKNNLHKKMTFESKFDRKYACWAKNNRKAWMFWKRRNRKIFRKKSKNELRSEEY